MFGTSGIRKVFAGFGNEKKNFTPEAALKIGLAIGTYINGGKVIVGRDIRTTALPIELAVNSGLVSTGCKVLTIGTVTTPTVAMAMKFLGADCGIMITASHNTPEYIGLKLWNPSGLAFRPIQEETIEKIYDSQHFKTVEWDKIGTITNIPDINELHVNEILKLLELGSKQRPEVIIDPGNGSSYEIAPLLMKKLGCKFATLNSNPDGTFPGRLSEPTSKNLEKLISFIKATDTVDFGIALDGDADRVIFIDGNGKVIEPIRMLAFLSKQLLLKDPPTNGRTYKIVTPINSSSVLESVVKPVWGEVVRSEVGDAKVAIKMQKIRAIIGGENCGTYIWPKFHLGPDSLVTIATVVEILSHTTKSFTELISEIPEFLFLRKEFPLIEDIPLTKKHYTSIEKNVKEWLKSEGYHDIKTNMLDGVRLDFSDGWVMIRRSGTSPIIRIECEHKNDPEKLDYINNSVAEILKNEYHLI
ncbi:MAG: phosphoglucosamine mutase [Candidatus Lokiarchaeota archaeon]|nr:phosphoglucosamine mutase [Candidatus Lokiarchaeota archaeon]